jgi:hypothetical protein
MTFTLTKATTWSLPDDEGAERRGKDQRTSKSNKHASREDLIAISRLRTALMIGQHGAEQKVPQQYTHLPKSYDRVVFTEKCNNVFDLMVDYASQGVKWAM